MATPEVTGNVILTHAVGLHARPSVKLTKLAKTFDASVFVGTQPDGPWIDAKSIVKVMGLKLGCGTVLEIDAAGAEADAAVSALRGLVEDNFGETA